MFIGFQLKWWLGWGETQPGSSQEALWPNYCASSWTCSLQAIPQAAKWAASCSSEGISLLTAVGNRNSEFFCWAWDREPSQNTHGEASLVCRGMKLYPQLPSKSLLNFIECHKTRFSVGWCLRMLAVCKHAATHVFTCDYPKGIFTYSTGISCFRLKRKIIWKFKQEKIHCAVFKNKDWALIWL